MASKTSAVADQEPIEVLIALHDKFELMDFTGPVETLMHALHDVKDPGMMIAPLVSPVAASRYSHHDSPIMLTNLFVLYRVYRFRHHHRIR